MPSININTHTFVIMHGAQASQPTLKAVPNELYNRIQAAFPNTSILELQDQAQLAQKDGSELLELLEELETCRTLDAEYHQ